jgi:DnaJ-class molecular chaperone|tara:strand:+ start:607 stop:783 length:177 start_codon:yes stop_codon:yes gene_type:complete
MTKDKKKPKAKLTKLPPCIMCKGSGIEEEKMKGYRRYKCWCCNGTGTQHLNDEQTNKQ